MDYFEEHKHFFEAKAKTNRRTKENELAITDKYLYETINIILKIPNISYIRINFSDIPVEEEILAKLSEIKTLTKLELSFMFSNITKIPESIFSLTNLNVLHISNIETTELQSTIGKLKNLEALTLIQAELTTLPESIAELTKLKVLELDINNITHLPSCIGELRELEYICLYMNNLSELPESMGDLLNLKELDLKNNSTLLSIPQGITNLQTRGKLKKLLTDVES